MARAYKCDKCGNFFLPVEESCYAINIGILDIEQAENDYDLYDNKLFHLCPKCFGYISKMFKEDLKEVDNDE